MDSTPTTPTEIMALLLVHEATPTLTCMLVYTLVYIGELPLTGCLRAQFMLLRFIPALTSCMVCAALFGCSPGHMPVEIVQSNAPSIRHTTPDVSGLASTLVNGSPYLIYIVVPDEAQGWPSG